MVIKGLIPNCVFILVMAAQYSSLYDNVVVNLSLNKTILSLSAKHLYTLEKSSLLYKN